MFERILYIVSEKQEDKHFVLDLARKHGSTVLLSGIMVPECQLQVKTDSSTRARVIKEDQERRCWQDIYSLEEEFKASGIKSSVIAQEGSVDRIQQLASSTHCDLIVLAAGNLVDSDYKLPEELIPNLPCPLIVTNVG
jgi:nucleotide-binding universal stress UspA family protein